MNYLAFVKAIYDHYHEVFNHTAPLKLYFATSDERKSIRSISSLPAGKDDYLYINFEKIKADEAVAQDIFQRKKQLIEEGKEKEHVAARLTFSAFADDFLKAYVLAESRLRDAEAELVPNELSFTILQTELQNGIKGRLKAHERIKDEFRERIEKATEQKEKEQEDPKSGSDTSSSEVTKRTRARLLGALKGALVRVKAKREKKKDEDTRSSTPQDQFSAKTALDFMERNKAYYEGELARYETIGRACAILFDDTLFELFIDPDNALRTFSNQVAHGSKMHCIELKEALGRATEVVPDVSLVKLEGLKKVYDVVVASDPSTRFDPNEHFKNIMDRVEWPMDRNKKRDSRFAFAPNQVKLVGRQQHAPPVQSRQPSARERQASTSYLQVPPRATYASRARGPRGMFLTAVFTSTTDY